MTRLVAIIILFVSVSKADIRAQTFLIEKFGSERLNANFIYDITQDNSGQLIVASSNGIHIYDGTNFETINTKNGLSENFVEKIELNKNVIWFSYYSGGYGYVKNNKVVNLNLQEKVLNFSSNQDQIHILFDGYEKKYKDEVQIDSFSTDNKSILFIDDNTALSVNKSGVLKFKNLKHEAIIDSVNFIETTKIDNYFISINKKNLNVLKIENNKVDVVSSFVLSFNPVEINDLYLKNKTLLIATKNSGVHEYTFNKNFQDYSYTNYSKTTGLISNNIQTCFIDIENNLWFGSYGDGLCFLPFTKNSNFEINDKIKINDLIHFNNKILIGSDQGLLTLTPKTNEITKTKGKTIVINCFKKFNQNILVGTNKGLYLYKDNNLFPHHFDNFLNNVKINSIQIENETIFLGTDSGLYIINTLENKKIHITTNEGLAHNIIEHFIIDKNRTFWFDSPNSPIYSYFNGEFRYYKNVSGFESFNITDIIETSSGEILFATNGDGIFKVNYDEIVKVPLEYQLFSDKLYFLKETHNNQLIIGHRDAITIINLLKGEIISHNKIPGLSNINNKSSLLYNDELWIATDSKLKKLSTKNILKNKYQPNLFMDKLIVNKDTLRDKKKTSLMAIIISNLILNPFF
ncbi:MAG: hypothetical protein ACWA41_09365 [Putridiphycobacter sp.]